MGRGLHLGGGLRRRRLGDAGGRRHGHAADPAGHAPDAGGALAPVGPRLRVGTVDRLSGGRAVLGAGLGALHAGWTAFEADEGRRVRAEKLDEGLAVFDGLMRGQPFSFEGKHYSARPTDFLLPPPPVQQPRPAGVGGGRLPAGPGAPALPRACRSLGRPAALRRPPVPDRAGVQLRPRVVRPTWSASSEPSVSARACRGRATTSSSRPIRAASSSSSRAALPTWAEAGGTWWVESWWGVPPGADGLAEVRRRVQAGPPAG